MELIADSMQYGSSEKANDDKNGIPVLRMGNIQEGDLDFSDLKYLPKNLKDINKLLLNPQDLIFNRTNSAELVGKTAVYKNNQPVATFASYLIRVKVSEFYNSEFLSFVTNSLFGRSYIDSVVTQQVGQANVNGQKYKKMPIPILSLDEMNEIVQQVNSIISQIKYLNQSITINLGRIQNLRQSILQKAFSGKLLNQDVQ